METAWGAARIPLLPIAAARARVDSGAYYFVGLAVVVVIVIVAMIVFYRTWLEVREEEEPDSPEDILESFREAHEAGEIDDAELERLRSLLLEGEGLDPARSLPRQGPPSSALLGREPGRAAAPDASDRPPGEGTGPVA